MPLPPSPYKYQVGFASFFGFVLLYQWVLFSTVPLLNSCAVKVSCEPIIRTGLGPGVRCCFYLPKLCFNKEDSLIDRSEIIKIIYKQKEQII